MALDLSRPAVGPWPLTPRAVLIAIAAASALSLIAALILQYGFGVAPCPLCIWQRWPHLAVAALGGLALVLPARPLLALAALLLLGNAALAAYHVGVEQGWWTLPAGCVAGAGASDVEELKRLLTEAPPTCDQVAFTLLGLSLAAWNLVLCVALAALAATALLRPQALRRPA